MAFSKKLKDLGFGALAAFAGTSPAMVRGMGHQTKALPRVVKENLPEIVDTATSMPISSLASELKKAHGVAKAAPGFIGTTAGQRVIESVATHAKGYSDAVSTWSKAYQEGPAGAVAKKYLGSRKGAIAVPIVANVIGLATPFIPAGMAFNAATMAHGKKLMRKVGGLGFRLKIAPWERQFHG